MEFSTIITIIGAILTPYTVIIGRLHFMLAKLQDKMGLIYTKGETKEMVELMTSPIKDTTQNLIDSHEKLITAIHKLELTLATTGTIA